MSEADNQEIVRAMVAALNRGDLDEFESYYADDVAITVTGSGHTFQGRAAVRRWLDDVFDVFDGFVNDVVGIYADDDHVVLEVLARGDLTREWRGMGPDPDWRNPEVYVYRLADGLIVEGRGY